MREGEAGLADVVVARVMDAAQSVQDSLRPFALKGDIPTATFRWKPWVTRVALLAVLGASVALAWTRGPRLLERILPPELLPSETPSVDRALPDPPGTGTPAETPVASPTPTPVPTPVMPDDAEYALDIRTVPPRASALVGSETIITPGVISLGAFPQPVELRVEKLGYETESIPIDRTGFARSGGRLTRVISLTLRTATSITPPGAASTPLLPSTPTPTATPTPPTPPPPPQPPAAKAPTPAPKASTPAPGTTKPGARKPTAKSPAPKKEAAAAAVPAPPATPGVSPLQAAQACLARGDNACAVDALQGKARTAREIELLVETHRAMGNQPKAWDAMRTYLERFPDEKRAEGYRRTLGQ